VHKKSNRWLLRSDNPAVQSACLHTARWNPGEFPSTRADSEALTGTSAEVPSCSARVRW